MRMKTIHIGFYCLLLSLQACASLGALQVTYYSDPSGASLYEDGKYMGQAPVTLRYNLSNTALQSRATKIKGLTARWVSGATTSLNLTNVNLNNGFQQTYTFVRPTAYPGREMDVAYAIESNKQKAVNQAKAAREAQCTRIANAQYSKAILYAGRNLSGIGVAAAALTAKNDAMARCMAGLPISEITPPASPPQRQQRDIHCTTSYLGGQAYT